MQNYYYRDKAGQEIGPLTLDALAKLRFAGVLDGDTPVRVADSAEWKPCREIIADPSQPLPAQTSAAPAAKSPLSPFLIAIVIIAALAYGGITLYKSVAAKTTLKYGFSLDGKMLTDFTLEIPEVKVDGQTFTNGSHLNPGRHQISVSMGNVEPYERQFWIYNGEKNLGTLPLEYSKGSLSVAVNPSPATVILKHEGEEVRRGDAPLNVDKLPVGDYMLVIQRGEYEETRLAKIQREQQTVMQVDLDLGSVDLSSDPADAEFDLSGKGRHWQGKLPTKIEEVPGGNYSLVVSRKGWELNKNVSVTRSVITTQKVEFPYGSIEVTSDPTGMTVLTNGVEIGKTPMTLQELKPGQYTLTVSSGEDYLTANCSISVGPNEAAKHRFVFHYGTVLLSSTPPGATVVRKGKGVGKTPLTLHIPVGNSSVELRLDGYASTNLVIGATEGVTANVTVKLISVGYSQAMQQAGDAFAAGLTAELQNQFAAALAKFAESQKNIDAALAIEPGNTDAVNLQTREAEAEQRVEMEMRFSQLTGSIPDSDKFVIYSRIYASDFDKVWSAANNVLKQQYEVIINSNPQNGLIITDLKLHDVPSPYFTRYLILVERSGGNTTKVNLEFMRLERSINPATTEVVAHPGRKMQGGVFEQGANDILNNIFQELKNAP